MNKLIIAALLAVTLLAKPVKADAGLVSVFVITFVAYFVITYGVVETAKVIHGDTNNTKPVE